MTFDINNKSVKEESVSTVKCIVKELMGVVYSRVDNEIKYIDEEKNSLLVLYTKSKIKQSLLEFKYDDAI